MMTDIIVLKVIITFLKVLLGFKTCELNLSQRMLLKRGTAGSGKRGRKTGK